MWTRPDTGADDGALQLDLTEQDLLADLDPGWLAWQRELDAALTTAA